MHIEGMYTCKNHILKTKKGVPYEQIAWITFCFLIALQHHERYDGNGSPSSFKGEDIHIYGRIVALADVFDALSHDRVYKEAWLLDKILNYIQEERGGHFDPLLADILMNNLDEFLKIRDSLPDQ